MYSNLVISNYNKTLVVYVMALIYVFMYECLHALFQAAMAMFAYMTTDITTVDMVQVNRIEADGM
jgi:hypothetical protein